MLFCQIDMSNIIDNSVTALQALNFCKLSLTEQIKIREAGRPVPHLKIQETGKSRGCPYTRHFPVISTNNSIGYVDQIYQTDSTAFHAYFTVVLQHGPK
jgi:hypothetical protein